MDSLYGIIPIATIDEIIGFIKPIPICIMFTFKSISPLANNTAANNIPTKNPAFAIFIRLSNFLVVSIVKNTITEFKKKCSNEKFILTEAKYERNNPVPSPTSKPARTFIKDTLKKIGTTARAYSLPTIEGRIEFNKAPKRTTENTVYLYTLCNEK
jgi:hypothetical protein